MIARTSPQPRGATPVEQAPPRRGGLIKPLLAYALLLAISRKAPQRNEIGPRSFGSVPHTTAARDSRHETSRPSRPDVKDSGRGRTAKAPWEIPWKGWKDILWRTYAQIGEDRMLAVAAGVVFYGLLALFPAITAIVSLYGFFAQASGIHEHLSLVAGLLPGGAVDIIQEQVDPNRLKR